MEREAFRRIVADYERKANRYPKMYRLGVWINAITGLLAMPALFLLGLAMVVTSLWIIYDYQKKVPFPTFILMIAGGYLVLFTVRAMTYYVATPVGLPVERKAGCKLWEAVDELSAKIGSRPIHYILLNAELGAGIVEHPRRGLIFGYTNYLMIGLPLMGGLTREQLLSVIAHELGHLSRRDGRLGAWVYRLHRIWQRIQAELAEKPRHPLARFLNKYVPKFSAQSFVLRRQQEYGADAIAKEYCGIESTGDALLMTYLREQQMEDFWADIWRRAAVSEYPPHSVMNEFVQRLDQLPDEEQLRKELAGSLSRRTNEYDTHPALADRLNAIGYLKTRDVEIDSLRGDPFQIAQKLPLPRYEPPSAAVALLGDDLAGYTEMVAEDWSIQVAEKWQNRHNVLLRDQGLLKIFEQQVVDRTISADDAFRRASIIESIYGLDQTADSVRLALELNPNNAPANYLNGRLLLKKKDPAGIEFIETAMRLTPEAVIPGCGLLYEYHTQQNQHDLAEKMVTRNDEHVNKLNEMRFERGYLPSTAGWEKDDLTREQREQIISVCKSLYPVKRAYLVKRIVRHFPELKNYSLVIIGRRWPWWKPYNDAFRHALANELISRITLKETYNVFVIKKDDSSKRLRKRLKYSPEFCIYDHTRLRGW